MKVARPVFLDADLDRSGELNKGEREAVRLVFEGGASRFGYSSLVGLQERERSLRNAASRAPGKEERARRTALADAVKTEIEQAMARAQIVVIRRRAAKAVTGFWSWVFYVIVVGGLITFAAATDWVSSEREDPIAKAKACGEARTAGATAGELGRTDGVCDGEGETSIDESEPPSAAEARASMTAQLVAALEACVALIQEAGDPASGPLNDEDCDPLRDAISAMSRSGP